MENSLDSLLLFIKDDRIRRLTEKVWSRIPDYDRVVVLGLITGITENEGEEHNLGFTSPANASTVENGCAGDAALNLDYYVNLGGVNKVKSDQAGMAVIAHEFAHLVLRHNQFFAVIDTLRGCDIYSENDIDEFNTYDEEAADLLVWVWGFQDELRAFFDEFPKTLIPRWFVNISSGEE